MSGTVFNFDLVTDLATRDCVIFLGAGVSSGITTNDGKNIQGWVDFLRGSIALIRNPDHKKLARDLLKKGDFLLCCEFIKNEIGEDSWNRRLENEFKKVPRSSKLLDAVFQLNQRLYITTNFDKILETRWSEYHKNASRFPNIVSKIDSDAFKAFRSADDYIFKIHGTIDDLKSLIFSSKDYASKSYTSAYYNKFIETVLLTKTILFIGFSLDDPAISRLLEVHSSLYPSSRPHYIFLPNKVNEKYNELLKTIRKTFVISYNSKNKHAELFLKIKQLVADVNRRRREILIGLNGGSKIN